MSRQSSQRRSAKKRNAAKPEAKWRDEPASERQLKLLEVIASETKIEIRKPLTKGEASELITAWAKVNPDSRRALRRAYRARKRAETQQSRLAA
jgi:hypothetical protein